MTIIVLGMLCILFCLCAGRRGRRAWDREQGRRETEGARLVTWLEV
jgi:hypothetical protein